MGLFGEYLVSQGAISEAQLEETVRSQAVYGGRIGTSLLERGFMGLEDLAHHLAAYHGFPLPPTEWLEAPDERAIKLVPLPLIRRCKLLPLRVDQETLHVAMQDPSDEKQIEFLGVASGRAIKAYVLPEVRLAYWLEIHHGIDRHPRLINLATRSRQMGMSELEAESATPIVSAGPRTPLTWDDVEVPDLAVPASSRKGPEPEEIVLLEEIFAEPDPLPEFEFPAAASTGGSGDRLISSRIANLEAQLHAATERDEIVRLGIEIARSYSRVSALFLVKGGVVSGYRGDGEGMKADLGQVEIPLETASVFTHPVLTRTPFRGEPLADGIDGRVMDALGRCDVREVVIMPIGIGDRVVNLLYADNGSDGFGETSIAALTALCDGLSRVYERVILDRKKDRWDR
jgi:hypothetical protein